MNFNGSKYPALKVRKIVKLGSVTGLVGRRGVGLDKVTLYQAWKISYVVFWVPRDVCYRRHFFHADWHVTKAFIWTY